MRAADSLSGQAGIDPTGSTQGRKQTKRQARSPQASPQTTTQAPLAAMTTCVVPPKFPELSSSGLADAAALQPSVSAPLSAPSPVTLPVLPSNLPLERVPLPSHGGQVRAVMVHFPTAPQPYYDLSTGISPYPYPLRMPEVSVLARLPEEEEEADLQAAAAFAYGLTHPDMVVAGAGSQSLIALLPRLLPAQRVCLLGPTYSGHAQAWYLQGVPVQQVTDPSALEHAAEQPGTVCVVCNPNNPDGRLIASEWMHRLADRCAEHGSFLVVDEAFADFEQESIAPLLPHPALGVLRSFGKTYGLPGVRLGFLLANPERAAQARALLGSWSVGSLALAAGRQALRDTAWLHTARAQARAAHTRLTTLLDAAGLPHTGQVSLFTLVLHQLAPALWQHFCTYGLVTRIFAEQPGRLRVGLPASEAAWARLETALQAWTALHAGGAP